VLASALRAAWTAALRRGRQPAGNPALQASVRTPTMTTLYVRDSSGFREATSTDILNQAQCIISRRLRPGARILDAPARVREFLRLHLGHLEHEVFGVIHLDARNRLIAIEDLFRGTLSAAQVHPREVVKSALAHNAMYVIAYHNHPSGVSVASPADDYITQRLKDALALVDIALVDHLVVGETVFSMAQQGLV
jgi:DNA repair protein RadC